MIRYTVWVNDDKFEFESRKSLNLDQIAERLGCDVEEIIQVDDEEA